MKAERQYFMKLYKNQSQWETYTKREINAIKTGLETLLESAQLPIDNRTLLRRYDLTETDLNFMVVNQKDLFKTLNKLGKGNKRELGSIREKIKKNTEFFLIGRQDGIEITELFAQLEIPFDKKIYKELEDYFLKNKKINLDSYKDILYVSNLVKLNKQKNIPNYIEKAIENASLFRNKEDVIKCLIRNQFELEDYLLEEDYIKYTEKKEPDKLRINY